MTYYLYLLCKSITIIDTLVICASLCILELSLWKKYHLKHLNLWSKDAAKCSSFHCKQTTARSITIIEIATYMLSTLLCIPLLFIQKLIFAKY